MIHVSVVYAEATKQTLLEVNVAEGATAQMAIDQSGIRDLYPSLVCRDVGVFGKKIALDTVLCDGDRVEIYRPLPVDPKTARMLRGKTR